MPFRASPYIDFNTDVVVTPPMDLVSRFPKPWSVDQKIEIFECMVDVWQLGAAVAILKQIESHQQPSIWSHSAYTLISITFSYFEMLGKSLNPNSAPRNTAGTDFNFGFCDVYPAFCPSNGNYSDRSNPKYRNSPPNPDIQPVVRIRDRVRNGVYHLGYTKGAVFIHNPQPPTLDFQERQIPDPNNSGSTVPGYFVNPHGLVRTLVDHFPTFIQRLGVTTNTTLRQKFEGFFDQFLAP